jgi:hypothetical protein
MAWVSGKKVKLAKGRKNKRAAQDELAAIRYEASKNPPPESPDQTVASVIETYLTFARPKLAPSTLELRQPYLQSFAETCGWRTVSECLPLHMEAWLQEHPDGSATGRRTEQSETFRWPSTGRQRTESLCRTRSAASRIAWGSRGGT